MSAFQTASGKFSRRDHCLGSPWGSASTLGLLAALLIRMSMRPNFPRMASRASRSEASLVMSAARPRHSGPWAIWS